MATIETLTYLEQQLEAQIKGFDDSRKYFRKQQFRVTIVMSAMSAATTFLIGAEKILKIEWLSLFALLLSSTLAVAAAWDQFMRSKELWIQKTDTWMALQNLRAHIEYEKAKSGDGNITQEQVDTFYGRFDSIIMSEHESWKKVRDTPGTAKTKLK